MTEKSLAKPQVILISSASWLCFRSWAGDWFSLWSISRHTFNVKLDRVSDLKSYQSVHFLVPELLEKKPKGQNGVIDSVRFSKT